MFAARFFVPFLAFTGLAVFASPVEIEKRAADVSNVLSIVSTLQGKTSTILPQLNNLVSEKKATQESVTPLLAELVTALNSASTSFELLGPVSGSGGTQEDVATAFAPIVSDIAVTLNSVNVVVPDLVGILGGLLGGLLGGVVVDVDVALNEVLVGLDVVLEGVVVLVSGLLVDVAVLLEGLSFTLSLLTLGL